MKFSKQQWYWIFYDWANSGYGILVTTAVLPVYFKAISQNAGVSAANSTAYWGYANSIGTLIVSLLAPLLGTLADYPHTKRRWLLVWHDHDLCFSLGTGKSLAVTLNGLHTGQYWLFWWQPFL